MARSEQEIAPPIGRSAIFGLLIVIVFLGGFITWAAVAPLESAAIAPGIVLVDSNRKTVEHLEGGIVGSVLVQDGAHVQAGEALIHLDETVPKANLQRLHSELNAAVALESRLIAERDQSPDVEFPAWLSEQATDSMVADILDGQRNIFDVRRDAMISQTRILEQRTAQIKEEIAGLTAEIRAQNQQLALIEEEITGVETLVKKGLERKPRLLLLQRQAADIEGARARNVSQIARLDQSIGEVKMRIVDLHIQLLNSAVQELREVQTGIADLRERIPAAKDLLMRTTIRAPVSGTVINLKVFTAGDVIAPGESLMEIVPADDLLIVEAHLSPTDIDVVTAGLPVQLRFTAFNQRAIPTFQGRVTQVSADHVVDERTGEAYYSTRITIEDERELQGDFKLYPGMPVEAMISTGANTPLGYLTKPIFASLGRAMRED